MKKKWWQLPLKFNPSPYSPPTPPLTLPFYRRFHSIFFFNHSLSYQSEVCMYV